MRQIRLKSVVHKLGILGVYLLFLSVQLNLRYTFSDSPLTMSASSAGYHSEKSDNSDTLNRTKQGKPAFQKLRLNKRFEHKQIYQIAQLAESITIRFRRAPNSIITATTQILTPSLCTSFLRGPPQPMDFTV
jgi:hypothetical protein